MDGRLPSNTRCGTSQSGVPSAFTSLGGLAERERLGLREDVRHQDVVVAAERIQRLREPMKSHGNEPRALVDQLVERVLAVGAGLAPVDRAGVVVDARAVERHVLAVALHRQLLQVGGEALQVLLVGQHGDRLRAEEVGVPDGEQAQQHRQVALERRGAEVLVHLVEAGEHRAEVRRGRSASIVDRPIAESIE